MLLVRSGSRFGEPIGSIVGAETDDVVKTGVPRSSNQLFNFPVLRSPVRATVGYVPNALSASRSDRLGRTFQFVVCHLGYLPTEVSALNTGRFESGGDNLR